MKARVTKMYLDQADELIEHAPKRCSALAGRVGSVYTDVRRTLERGIGDEDEEVAFLAFMVGKLSACVRRTKR